MTANPPTIRTLTNGDDGVCNGVYDIGGNIQFYINNGVIYDRTETSAGNLAVGGNPIAEREAVIVPFLNNDACHNNYYVFYEKVFPLVHTKLYCTIIEVDRTTWALSISTAVELLDVSSSTTAMAVGKINSNKRSLYWFNGGTSGTAITKFTIGIPNSSDPDGISSGLGILSATGAGSGLNAPTFEADLSNDGTKLAWGGGNDNFYVASLDGNGDFDAIISSFNLPNSSTPPYYYRGVEFDDSGNKLYVSNGAIGTGDGVFVADITNASPTPSLISGSQYYGAGQIEKAYNGLVYITNGSYMVGIDQSTDLIVSASGVALNGSVNLYLPDQIDGDNIDTYLSNLLTYDVSGGLTLGSGLGLVWEPGNNPFGNTSAPVKVKDAIRVEGVNPSTFVSLTIRDMVFEFGPNSSFEVALNGSVALEHTTFKGADCAVMWDGVKLESNASFYATVNSMTENSIIQDAIVGIDGQGPDFYLEVHGNTLLTANADDIKITEGDGSKMDIHNCLFYGDAVLKDQMYGSNNGWTDDLYRTNNQITLQDCDNSTTIGGNCEFYYGQVGIKAENSDAYIGGSTLSYQKVYGINADANRIAPKQVDIIENVFAEVNQPVRLERWINSNIQTNSFASSGEYGINYLGNEGCVVTIGDETDDAKANIFNYCNWAAINLTENAGDATSIVIGYNVIEDHPDATGIQVIEYAVPSSGSSYAKLRINNNTMNAIGSGIKLDNVRGLNGSYIGQGPRPHTANYDPNVMIENNLINFTTDVDPYKIGIL